MGETRRIVARRRSTPSDAPVTVTRRMLDDIHRGRLVLLADDDEETREMYGEAFGGAGFRIGHAVDGEHALLKTMAQLPDLVVMDLAMPVLDGWEATKRIKMHPRTQHIPVIVLTGYATPPEIRHAYDAGADAVLVKPCTPRALLFVAGRLLGSKGQSARATSRR